MKKITLIATLLLSGMALQAQTEINVGQPFTGEVVDNNPNRGTQLVLSQNDDQTIVTGTVACANSAGGFTTENNWFRTYVPADFGVTDAFEIQGLQWAHTFTDNGATGLPIDVTIRAWTSDDVFPAGTYTLLTEENYQGDASTADQLLDFPFNTPVTVSADTEIIVQVFIVTGETNVQDVRLYDNDLGHNGPVWILSESCSITTPTTMDDIGFPDNHTILNLLGEETVLSVEDNLSEVVSIFPNPVNDILNVRVPSNIEITGATLYDILGKDQRVNVVNGQINVSALNRGVYILNLETSAGVLTQKIVKQ